MTVPCDETQWLGPKGVNRRRRALLIRKPSQRDHHRELKERRKALFVVSVSQVFLFVFGRLNGVCDFGKRRVKRLFDEEEKENNV